MDEPLSKPNIMSSDFDRRTTLSSFATIYGIGYLSYMLMPLQIGALIESLALNEAQAGVIATAELLSLALALFVAPILLDAAFDFLAARRPFDAIVAAQLQPGRQSKP